MICLMTFLLAQAPLPETKEKQPEAVAAAVDVHNDMGKRFKLVEASVILDDAQVAHRKAPPGQELERSFRAYSGSLAPGAHAVTVRLVYEGRNAGIFTYLDNYTFEVENTQAFAVAAGKAPATLRAVARERKGATVALEKRPLLDIIPAPQSAATVVVPARADPVDRPRP